MLGAPDLTDRNLVWAALLAALTILASLLLYRAWRRRNTPAERERRRRLQVNSQGRIAHGTVVDIHALESGAAGLIHYTYTIGGVDYSAAQDISALAEHLGGDPARFVGSTSVKYLTRNPGNSIVVCEHWSGLQQRSIENAPL